MIRILLGSLAFALALSTVAVAEDQPAPPALTIRQVMEINAALGQMNCEMKLLTDGAKQTSACIPYPPEKLKVGLAWLIAKNQHKTAEVAQSYQRQVNAFLATLPRKADGNVTDEASAKFIAFQYDLQDKAAFLPGEALEHFKKVEIESLNLQPAVISGLLPIIDP